MADTTGRQQPLIYLQPDHAHLRRSSANKILSTASISFTQKVWTKHLKRVWGYSITFGEKHLYRKVKRAPNHSSRQNPNQIKLSRKHNSEFVNDICPSPQSTRPFIPWSVDTACSSATSVLVSSSLSEKDVSDILCDWISNFPDRFSRTSCLCCSSAAVRCSSVRRLPTSDFILSYSWKRVPRPMSSARSMAKPSPWGSSNLSRIPVIFWTIARSCSRDLSVASRRADSYSSDWTARARSLLSISKVACWLSRCVWRPAAASFDDSASAVYLSRSWLKVLIWSSLSWLMWPTRNNWWLRMPCWFWRMLISRWSFW